MPTGPPSAAAYPRASSSTTPWLGGPLDLAIGLAGLLPEAMAYFIDKHGTKR